MQPDAHRARRVPHHRHLALVAAKLLNVLLDPLKGEQLVLEADVEVEFRGGARGDVRRDGRRGRFGRRGGEAKGA